MQFGGQIRQPGAKRTLRGCLLGPAGAVLLALAVVPPAAFATSWANGSEAVLPANASSFQGVNLSSVSCGSAGNCSAVGDYVDSSNNRQGLLLNEVNGVWQAGIEPTLPANALSGYSGAPDSVSCPSAGNCTAVGDYTDTGREGQGLLLTETNGTWATGQEASLPAGAIPITVILSSVSCASVGNCTAVGEYTDTNRAGQGVLLTETNGVWATGVKAPLPANASTTQPGVQLWSVSCASAGNCTAVGFYYDTAGNRQGVLLTETGGTWGTGEEAVLPAGAAANPFVILTAVSCGSAGDCSAVGEYQTKSGTGGGLLLT